MAASNLFNILCLQKTEFMKLTHYLLPFIFIALPGCRDHQAEDGRKIAVSVTVSKSASDTPKDGRLLLMFSNNEEQEPRFQINGGLQTQLLFGMNAEDWQPGEKLTDKYTLTLPPGTPPDDHRLRIGWYQSDSGEVVPVVDDTGQPVADYVVLDVVVRVE